MSVRVGIAENPFDPSTWSEHECEDPRALLRDRFPTWPSTARIFDLSGFGSWRRAAALTNPTALSRRDVTPLDLEGVERLAKLEGPLLVVVVPADPTTIIVTVLAGLAGLAASFLFRPSVPPGQRAASPNNSLASRTNQPRVNGRIADIFGTVESTLDLLAVPYNQYIDGQKVETSYMAIGRGEYEVSRVRDGDTNIASISGSSVAVWAPFTSPNSGDDPVLEIGPTITEPVRSVVRLNEVNGQVLKPSNVNRIQGEDSIRFVYPDVIETNDGTLDFTDYFAALDAIEIAQADIEGSTGSAATTAEARFLLAGEIEFSTIDPSAVFAGATTITIVNGTYAGGDGLGGTVYVDLTGTYPIDSLTATKVVLDDPAGVNSDWDLLDDYPSDRTEYRSINLTVPTETTGVNLNGSYTIASVSASQIVLNSPNLVNMSWDNLDDLPGDATEYVSPSLSRNTESWAGPFIVDLDETDTILANFVGMNGLYTLSSKKGKQLPLEVDVEIEVTPIDASDAPTGPAEVFPATLVGSRIERTTVGVTLEAVPSFTGRCSVRARRTSPTPDEEDFGAVVDEVKWEECFGLAPVSETEFGDVTTVMSRTVATPGALAVKERKLNMRVTRRVPERTGESEFGALVASDNVADILCAITLDPYIGRATIDEIDVPNVYDTVAAVEAYFGTPAATEFGYTFDDEDLSFQETAAIVSQVPFCTTYRQGQVIRLSFERATDDSSLIFNARNTLPGSQRRSVRFGPLKDHDGVEMGWVDPRDDAPLTFTIPAGDAPTSPLSVEVPGVRSHELAYWHGWRAWNKARYQNLAVEIEATQEAVMLVRNERVLIADRTRPDVLQGEVEVEDGTTLTLSHEAELADDKVWTIFLQHVDGSTEALGVESWVPGVGEDANLRKVTLSAAPSMPLSTDPANYARATYMIVPDDDVQTRAFLVTEREPAGRGTESVRAVNYSFLYYQHDQLELWLELTGDAVDSSPYGRHGTEAGGPTYPVDDQRGKVVYQGDLDSRVDLPAFDGPESYTKSVWLVPANVDGEILGTASAAERFGFASGLIRLAHNGVNAAHYPLAANRWFHVAVTYDATDGRSELFLNGELMSAGVAPARVPAPLVALYRDSPGFSSFAGQADDLRLWRRALSAAEIRDVFLSTRANVPADSISFDRTDITFDDVTVTWDSI